MSTSAKPETARTRPQWRGYAFRIALVCVLAAVILRPGEDRVSEAIAQLSRSGPTIWSIAFGCIALGFYVHALRRQRRYPDERFRNASILFRAAVATAGCVAYLGIALGAEGARPDLPFVIACGVYICAAVAARSALMGVFAMAALGGWLGAPTGLAPEWGSVPTAAGFAMFGICVWLLRLRAESR